MADHSSRSFRSRWHAILACAALILLSAAGVLFWRHTNVRQAQAAHTEQSAVPVTVDIAATRDVPIYFSGLGIVQASNTTALHTQVDGKLQIGQFHGRPARQEGRRAGQDRPAAFIRPRSTRPRPRRRQDEAQLVGAQKDLERFQTLVSKNFETQQNLDQQQVAMVDQVKASIAADDAAIETAQTQFDYTDHHRAERRPHGHAPGRSRQHRACHRHGADRDPDADETDLRHVHLAGRKISTTSARPWRAARLRSSPTTRTTAAARDRAHCSLIDNEHRSGHRHDQAQGEFPQRRRETVAGRIRQRARADRYPQGCAHRALGRHPARTARLFCLAHPAGQHRAGAADPGRRSATAISPSSPPASAPATAS